MGKNAPKGIKWDAQELRTLYEQQGLSTVEIARQKGVDPVSVCHQFRKFGITTRTKSDAARLRKSRNPPPRGSQSPFFKHGLDRGHRVSKTGGRRRFEHRQVAEKALERPLGSKEVVHHCNGIRSDNRPENLWVFPSRSAHQKYHKTGQIHPETIFLKDYACQTEK